MVQLGETQKLVIDGREIQYCGGTPKGDPTMTVQCLGRKVLVGGKSVRCTQVVSVYFLEKKTHLLKNESIGSIMSHVFSSNVMPIIAEDMVIVGIYPP